MTTEQNGDAQGDGDSEGDGDATGDPDGDTDPDGDGGNGDIDPGDGDGDAQTSDCDFGEIIPEPTDSEEDPCRPDDGWGSVVVFVATHGDDENTGALASPLQTITAGLDTAEAEDKFFVLVQAGTYEESFELRDGIQIIGAYDVGWTYQQSSRAIVRGGNPTMSGEDITKRTRVVNVRLDPVTEVDFGESVVTAYLKNSSGVALHNVQLNGGRAGDGLPGGDGEDGGDGERGGDGEQGSRLAATVCNFNDAPPGGDGATSTCGGGYGGAGGEGPRGDDTGEDGHPGSGGAAGGLAGGEEEDGGDGEDGAHGDDGEHGLGATSAGHFEGLQWVGENGTDGTDGTAGEGGGGGGSGGGEDTWGTCDRWGSSGGGGGSGGCLGTAGTGGNHGGAAITLFLEESDIEILSTRIDGGTAGDGGRGGIGGTGGSGGNGGNGGEENGAGAGGNGGAGGDGGAGGNGGGGAGGPAFAIFSTSPLTNEPVDSRIDEANGGRGGGPQGELTQAEDGLQADIQIGL